MIDEVKGVTVGVELIDQDAARSYLAKNNANRTIQKARVDQYKRDMKQGNWQFTGESITFYANGELKDGQHRLTAIAETGIAQRFVVVRGIPIMNILADKGQPRSTGQIAEMAGYNASIRSNLVIPTYKFLHKAAAGKKNPSDPEVFSFLDKYEETAMLANRVITKGNTNPIAKKAPVCAAAFCALMCSVPYDRLEAFFSVVNSGFADSSTQSAAIVIRKKIEDYDGTYQNRLSLFFAVLCGIQDFCCEIPRRNAYKFTTQHPWFTAVKKQIFEIKEEN